MSRARRHLAAIVIVIASLFGAAGCVNVPASGPIEKVEGQQPPCQNCVNVEVAPPLPGAEPREIVEGYLRATSNYQPNYSVARQFLTRMAAEKWSPEAGVLIYRGTPKAAADDPDAIESTVNLEDGWLVGSLGSDRTYAAGDSELNIDFHLTRENGDWRINDPPPGLMVAEFSFNSFYRPYDLYFIGNGRSLVPDPIYLPALINPANVASALMKALLKGPSAWLKPAVSSAIPPNTSLRVDSVTITNGIAEVPLSDSVQALPDPQRSLLASQIAYTLRQVGGVKGVLIKVNQQPYRVPGSDPNSLAISVDATPRDLDPVPFLADEELYAVRGGAVIRVTTMSDAPTVSELPGRLGHGAYPIDRLAVSATNTDFAATTNSRTALRRAPITTGEPRTLLSEASDGVSDLLRPQFTRYGEIWDIGRKDGRQRMWMFSAGEDPKSPGIKIEINSSVLQNSNVMAFKISPDGTRMALVRNTKEGPELGLARIIRSAPDKITVDGLRSLDLMQANKPQIASIADVAWLGATELLVLGAADATTPNTSFQVVQDASRITAQGGPENSNAVQLAALPGTQSSIIVGRDGRTWKDDGNQWLPFLREEVGTIAYPG